jgi:hypothetical protein
MVTFVYVRDCKRHGISVIFLCISYAFICIQYMASYSDCPSNLVGVTWCNTKIIPNARSLLVASLGQDIGEQDRMMSRLEAEMQVEPPDAGEFTFALLDKGNGKARDSGATWEVLGFSMCSGDIALRC